ncbi:MAG: DUF3108 domain-containing protein [Desulfobulbus sp.]|nr:DUF3108 domain-containing protein [Desulfobulbus sp.]
MRLIRPLVVAICLGLLTQFPGLAKAETSSAVVLQPRDILPETLKIIYSDFETLHYSVSWSGGVKIGDIYMEIRPQQSKESGYVISARVKDYGPLSLFYPIDDQFRCFVDGQMKLPTRYEVEQKEGSNHETTRLSEYNQEEQIVRYRKNKNKVKTYQVDGPVYNEFASFIITRALAFIGKVEIVVPTFADEKRHLVKVAVADRVRRRTIFGKIKTLKVQPKMQFRGLYEKSGNTTLWLTDDRCRVPVEIRSRIVVGSLVAELVEYTNSACPELRVKKQK